MAVRRGPREQPMMEGGCSLYLNPGATVRTGIPGIDESAVGHHGERPSGGLVIAVPVSEQHIMGRSMALVAVRRVQVIGSIRVQPGERESVLI